MLKKCLLILRSYHRMTQPIIWLGRYHFINETIFRYLWLEFILTILGSNEVAETAQQMLWKAEISKKNVQLYFEKKSNFVKRLYRYLLTMRSPCRTIWYSVEHLQFLEIYTCKNSSSSVYFAVVKNAPCMQWATRYEQVTSWWMMIYEGSFTVHINLLT